MNQNYFPQKYVEEYYHSAWHSSDLEICPALMRYVVIIFKSFEKAFRLKSSNSCGLKITGNKVKNVVDYVIMKCLP